MKAAEFLKEYRIRARLIHLGDLDTWSREGRHIRRAWSFVLTYNDGMTDRLLALDLRTGPDESTDTAHIAEIIASLASDANSGMWSFDEYLNEFYDPRNPSSPAKHYAVWIGLVWLRHRFDEWCRDDQMRADLYSIEPE